MPDDDYLERRLPRGWTAVKKALVRDAPLSVLSRLTERALAATIRDIEGITVLPDVCAEAHRAARRRSGALPIDGHQLGMAPRRSRLPQNDIAWRRAQVLVETRTDELAENFAAAQRLVSSAVVRDLAGHYGFGRIIPMLVGENGWDVDGLRDRCNEILSQPGIDKIGEFLARRPDGRNVKAPPRRRERVDDILGEGLWGSP
ncbi:hypothetical protein AB0L25_23245 [Spirillospora sp. NPDC052242]